MGGEDSDHSKPVKSSITDLKIQNIAYGLFRAVDGPVTYFRGIKSRILTQNLNVCLKDYLCLTS